MRHNEIDKPRCLISLSRMKTVERLLFELREHRPCSRAQLYRYLKAADVQPVGARLRPTLYPNDTVPRILAHLGLAEPVGCGQPGCPNGDRIVSMLELRKERSKSRRAK